MKDFDEYIKKQISQDDIEIPDNVKNRIEKTLINLPENPPITNKQKHFKLIPTLLTISFICIFLLPNISISYAKALENIPVIGDIIKVVTIRNYYEDETHELDANIPRLEINTPINDDIESLTSKVINEFYHNLEELGDLAHYSTRIAHEIVTNNDSWFTLKLEVNLLVGSSNTYYEYYHINKITGDVVTLNDIVDDNKFYDVVEEDLRKQMNEKMQEDENLVYWIEESIIGEDFLKIPSDHNFYFDSTNNLVIPFDKYEVAPGYMGTFEFTIDKDIIIPYLKPEIARIIE